MKQEEMQQSFSHYSIISIRLSIHHAQHDGLAFRIIGPDGVTSETLGFIEPFQFGKEVDGLACNSHLT
jgi:hypothetical protein